MYFTRQLTKAEKDSVILSQNDCGYWFAEIWITPLAAEADFHSDECQLVTDAMEQAAEWIVERRGQKEE